MMRVVILILTMILVTGCSRNSVNYQEFDGHFFPAKIKTERKNKTVFTVRVRGVDQGLDGAREAGRFEAVKYCVNTFGSSDIAWTAGPDDEELNVDGGQLTFTGTCLE